MANQAHKTEDILYRNSYLGKNKQGVVVKGEWERHDICSILLKYKHLPPWISQSQFRPFCTTITPANIVCTSLGGGLNGLMSKNLDAFTHAVTLIIKAAIMTAQFSGRIRKRNLKRLAAMEGDDKDQKGQTALHYAAKAGQIAVAELLIANVADVNAGEWTPLQESTYYSKEIVELLIAKGANINEVGWSPLHILLPKVETKITGF